MNLVLRSVYVRPTLETPQNFVVKSFLKWRPGSQRGRKNIKMNLELADPEDGELA
jgi:hypothetical protein